MVEILRCQQGNVHSAGEHRRHAELRQSDDVPGDGAGDSLTALQARLKFGDMHLARVVATVLHITGRSGDRKSQIYQTIMTFMGVTLSLRYQFDRAF